MSGRSHVVGGAEADSCGNEKLLRKWTKPVFFIRDQKFGQTYGNGFASVWFRLLV